MLLPGVGSEQPEQASEVLGPYLNIALDADGQPTRALQGFAQKAGVEWTQLARTSDSKGERFVHRAVRPGAATATLLPEILREAIAAMPIPKPMRWGAHEYAFARPVHWLVLLLGEQVVEANCSACAPGATAAATASCTTSRCGSDAPGDYVDALRGAKVLVDPDERRERIVREVEHAAHAAGGIARIDADNLEQVKCLVEWPSAVLVQLRTRLPRRAAGSADRDDGRPTRSSSRCSMPKAAWSSHFVGIANIESQRRRRSAQGLRARDPSALRRREVLLRRGPEAGSVVDDTRAWRASPTRPSSARVADKVARVAQLAEAIAREVGVDPALARRAAELSKADLQSRLVNEFPELQGIAGRYYAAGGRRIGREVADAIDEAYMPRFGGRCRSRRRDSGRCWRSPNAWTRSPAVSPRG